MQKYLIVTNNLSVKDKFSEYKVKYLNDSLIGILFYLRDSIHLGYKLLSHPLAGSVKPNETPFKSVLLSEEKVNGIDMQSLTIIENSIKMAEKLIADKSPRKWPERIIKDFSVIDLDLISSAIESAM